jgi:hypothetical protein
MKTCIGAFLVILAICPTALAKSAPATQCSTSVLTDSTPAAAAAAPADGWQFLLGEWDAVGEGRADDIPGWFSFAYDLDGHILTRRNHAEVPASNGRPAAVHDDLLIVYPGKDAGARKAMYFDNEGNVIQYKANVAPDGSAWVFENEPNGGPAFRLTIRKETPDRVMVMFDMAVSGKDFKTWVKGAAVRRKAK